MARHRLPQRYRYVPSMRAEATFNSLVGDLHYPMFIVTACAEGERSGCLIGFATQASIDPPRFLVGLSHQNRT
jgi:flavin reductase (DIM6/NTAB) family NADH-FMN oxidoreductase RutF